jgi:hypothetical protein
MTRDKKSIKKATKVAFFEHILGLEAMCKAYTNLLDIVC